MNNAGAVAEAVVVFENRLNDGAVVVAAVGANENVPVVVGLATEKPNDAPAVVVAAVLAAGNNEVAPKPKPGAAVVVVAAG